MHVYAPPYFEIRVFLVFLQVEILYEEGTYEKKAYIIT